MIKSNRKKLIYFLSVSIFIICFFLIGRVAFTQAYLVTIEGIIADEEGNPLPGTSISVRNAETGFVKNGVSSTDGRYVISGIQPGKYEVEVKLSGFMTAVRKGLTFNLGSRLTMNFTLTPSALEQEITVTAESPMVEVTKSEISSVVSREKIDDLPLLDRNFDQLTVLKAGVMTTHGGIRSNAQPDGHEEMVVDGISNENITYGSSGLSIPADAIEEFRVMTNQFEAEYGNASGLMRSALTRSGTNQFQGRVSFFYRDDTLDDVNYFTNHAEYQGKELSADQWEKPPFNQYRFGGFIGGPIVKDKAHFFLAYDGYRRTDYANITCPLVEKETIENPSTNNQILAKINYQLSEKHLFSIRYSYENRTQDDFLYEYPTATRDQLANLRAPTHDFQFNWTFYPSHNAINEFRFLFRSGRDEWNLSRERSYPDFWYSIWRPSIDIGPDYYLPQWTEWKKLHFINNLSLFLGSHNVKIGFEFGRNPWKARVPLFMPGLFIFTTDDPFNAADPDTYPLIFMYSEGNPEVDLPYWQAAAFIQDSWKVNSKLTLNFGLRYNYYDSAGADIATWNIRNLNPRIGFSYDPSGDGKSAIRGGVGTYTANPLANYMGWTQWLSGVSTYQLLFPNYPDPFEPNPFFPEMDISPPPEIRDQVEGQIPPYTLQATLGYQREVMNNLSIGVDFVYARGYRLMRIHQLNPVIPGTSVQRVDPTKADHWRLVDWGSSDYKGMYLTLNKRYADGWSLELSYTLSKSMTDTEHEQMEPNSYDDLEFEAQWGPSNYDARHILSLNGIVDLPFGFQLSGLFYYRSALPWNALYPTDVNEDSLVSDYVDEHRNARRGFDTWFVNARLSKYVTISRLRLQLFIEAYNLTNRTNFYNIYDMYGLPLFGKLTAAQDPRLLQFGARIDF